MKILCAWCLKEGKPALIGEKEPRDDETVSEDLHGRSGPGEGGAPAKNLSVSPATLT